VGGAPIEMPVLNRRDDNPQAPVVILRDAVESDLPVFFEHQREPEANRMAAFPPRDREAFDAHWAKVLRNKSNIVKTVLFDGRVAGNVGSWEQEGHRRIGYWIGKAFWGRGVATQALIQFLDQVTVRPLFAHVAKSNAASIRVLEKCGFTLCGQDKSPAPTGGEAVEEFVMRLGV
jgi:RimJ/RimL family protein N-acetyltransferase